ncbi:pimeloyl-ACP methyl ester carboxylesterase [Paraburkholderia sp. UCT70]|uniref:alpha/beta hydrolase n=1 Tax=Paraburkholderia sp. UCT70 TaxID=2991068 RepID=UPI003D223B5A
MWLLWTTVRLAVIAYVVAAIALYVFQDRLLLPAVSNVPDIGLGQHTGYDVQPWHPASGYAGYVVTPDGREPLGTFILYHGNAESAENKLPLADVFVRSGYRAVLVEYPGHGKRPGTRTMKAAMTASRSALAESRAQWGGPIFLVGESLGAGMAAQAILGEESVVAGALLITPWDSLASVASEKLRLFPVRWILHDHFDAVAALERYTGPLVVVGAANDTLIPVWHAERLALEHPHAQFMLLRDAGHDDWFSSMTADRWQQALRLLKVD